MNNPAHAANSGWAVPRITSARPYIMISRSRRKSPDTFETSQSIAAVAKKKAPCKCRVPCFGTGNSIDAKKMWGPARRGGAFAPYKRFRQRRKPWRRGNSFALSTFISHGIHKNSHTFRCGYFYGLSKQYRCTIPVLPIKMRSFFVIRYYLSFSKNSLFK